KVALTRINGRTAPPSSSSRLPFVFESINASTWNEPTPFVERVAVLLPVLEMDGTGPPPASAGSSLTSNATSVPAGSTSTVRLTDAGMFRSRTKALGAANVASLNVRAPLGICVVEVNDVSDSPEVAGTGALIDFTLAMMILASAVTSLPVVLHLK